MRNNDNPLNIKNVVSGYKNLNEPRNGNRSTGFHMLKESVTFFSTILAVFSTIYLIVNLFSSRDNLRVNPGPRTRANPNYIRK